MTNLPETNVMMVGIFTDNNRFALTATDDTLLQRVDYYKVYKI